MSKKTRVEKDFYYLIICKLKHSTNLIKIQKDLKISKQQLNYYLRGLKNNGHIIKKGRGWWEVVKSCKNTTQYGQDLKKDMIRGHAYIWKIKISKEIKNWNKRIDILKKNKINYKLVGIMKSTPRIKIYGRKIWLCNNHLRVFEKKEQSYYGDNAIESKRQAFEEMKIILQAVENRLRINLRPYMIQVRREHYALIKNDLAKYHNERGEIVRISDKDGEWLLVDDSLERGGELENIGKNSLPNNIHMKNWWNDNKKHNFQVTPSFLLNSINQVTQNQAMFNKNFETHVEAIRTLSKSVKELSKEVIRLKNG